VLHGILTGWAMFGSISFIPLFVQSVMGTSATQAGITVTPMLLGWVTASITGMRLIIKVGYRNLGRIGTACLVIGALLMTTIGAGSSQLLLMAFITLMGVGMGLSIPSFLVAVQSSVERRQLGTATSTLQFSRSIGGTLGVSVMGVALSLRLAANLRAAGLDAGLVSKLLDTGSGAAAAAETGARLALADAIHLVFLIAFVAALLGLVVIFFMPHRDLEQVVPAEGESQMVAD
jgi:MFS family permease